MTALAAVVIAQSVALIVVAVGAGIAAFKLAMRPLPQPQTVATPQPVAKPIAPPRKPLEYRRRELKTAPEPQPLPSADMDPDLAALFRDEEERAAS